MTDAAIPPLRYPSPAKQTAGGSNQTLAYGPLPDQTADLYLPGVPRSPVICLIHGGFWRLPYGREHLAPIALNLMQRGFAVWNIEYRRVGTDGGGWPGTLLDVVMAVEHLTLLAAQTQSLDLSSITLMGHSAGGQLALWAARQVRRVAIASAVGLAPVADLELAYDLRCGDGAVENFIGGSPAEKPARYAETSPVALLPLGVRQLIVHGALDRDVPVVISRLYSAAAKAAGDEIEYVELPDAAHMDFADPESQAHAAVCRRLDAWNFGSRD